MSEPVNHPPHYKNGKIEVIDYIEDKELNFNLGNAVKYISRAGRKNPEKYFEDLEKAVWYIRREIDRHKLATPHTGPFIPPLGTSIINQTAGLYRTYQSDSSQPISEDEWEKTHGDLFHV